MKIFNILRQLCAQLGLSTPAVNFICGNEALPQPLSAEDEQRFVQLALQGDSTAKDKLVEHNLRLVVYLAKKFENTGLDMEDLISVGTIEIGRAHV